MQITHGLFGRQRQLPRSNRRSRHGTDFIVLDTSRCIACWSCIPECQQEVIGRISFLGHRHARIRKPDDCIGCLKCVKVCTTGAIGARDAGEIKAANARRREKAKQ